MTTQLSAKAQMYDVLFNIMMRNHLKDKHDESMEMAEVLLLNDDLPLTIRIRCHMLLLANTEYPTIAVEHGQLAVQLLDENLRDIYVTGGASVGLYLQEQLDEAKELLGYALKALEAESVESNNEKSNDQDGAKT